MFFLHVIQLNFKEFKFLPIEFVEMRQTYPILKFETLD